jgi:hypothetical protein
MVSKIIFGFVLVLLTAGCIHDSSPTVCGGVYPSVEECRTLCKNYNQTEIEAYKAFDKDGSLVAISYCYCPTTTSQITTAPPTTLLKDRYGVFIQKTMYSYESHCYVARNNTERPFICVQKEDAVCYKSIKINIGLDEARLIKDTLYNSSDFDIDGCVKSELQDFPVYSKEAGGYLQIKGEYITVKKTACVLTEKQHIYYYLETEYPVELCR